MLTSARVRVQTPYSYADFRARPRPFPLKNRMQVASRPVVPSSERHLSSDSSNIIRPGAGVPLLSNVPMYGGLYADIFRPTLPT